MFLNNYTSILELMIYEIYPIIEAEKDNLESLNEDVNIFISRTEEKNIQLNIHFKTKRYELLFQRGNTADIKTNRIIKKDSHINVYLHTAKHSVLKEYVIYFDDGKWFYKKIIYRGSTTIHELTNETIRNIIKQFIDETDLF
ncbi:hypothetical protein [Lysinibacillus sp. OTC-L20]|uniref:hypothetical protein n=1 Tax=Lysinibacillus sp. OTC-L20 TaxID=3342791 RepID=UPI0035B9812E